MLGDISKVPDLIVFLVIIGHANNQLNQHVSIIHYFFRQTFESLHLYLAKIGHTLYDDQHYDLQWHCARTAPNLWQFVENISHFVSCFCYLTFDTCNEGKLKYKLRTDFYHYLTHNKSSDLFISFNVVSETMNLGSKFNINFCNLYK